MVSATLYRYIFSNILRIYWVFILDSLNIESLNKFFMLIEITDGFGGNELFNKIARVNAARLLYADKKYDEALNLLEKYSSP